MNIVTSTIGIATDLLIIKPLYIICYPFRGHKQYNHAYDKIDQLKSEQFIEESKIRELSAEVGPIKYIAQFFASDGEVDLERAVTWLIITIMFVFDPLAVLLLIAVNMSLKARYGWSFEGKGSLMQESTAKIEPDLAGQKKKISNDEIVVKRDVIKYYHELLDKVSKRLSEKPKTIEKIVEKPVVKKVEIPKIVEPDINFEPPSNIIELENQILNKMRDKGENNDQ